MCIKNHLLLSIQSISSQGKPAEFILENNEVQNSFFGPVDNHASQSFSQELLSATDVTFNEDVLNTLVDAILYEPTNAKATSNPYQTAKNDCRSDFTYITGAKPSSLNSYLREFASPTTALKDSGSVTVL